MVLINIYGKIQPLIISKKLGVGICNPAPDWIEGFCYDEFEEEILVHNHHMNIYHKSGMDIKNIKGRYNLPQIIKNYQWQEEGKSAKQIIAEHLIEIQVIDFENSLLQKKNENLDSPTCETQYSIKFLKFCNLVGNSDSARNMIPGQVPFITYDSDNLNEKPLIINYLEAMSKLNVILDTYTENCIKTLQFIGNLIDKFLVTDDDFWLLDYIINAINEKQENDTYHIFKVMSLIEMLIINPNGNGKTAGKIEKKLPQFLNIEVDNSEKELFSDIMRKLRNKIAHGDFKSVQKLLEVYRNAFMQNFWYDELEYSIENWTYGDICLHLDKALANILWLMVYDKEKLFSIRKN